jgi:hypothetical protein
MTCLSALAQQALAVSAMPHPALLTRLATVLAKATTMVPDVPDVYTLCPMKIVIMAQLTTQKLNAGMTRAIRGVAPRRATQIPAATDCV